MSVYAAQLGFAQAHPLCQWSLWQIKQAEKIPNLFQPSEVISQLIHGLQLQTNWTLSLCALKFKDHLPLCGSKNVYLVIAPCAECIVSVELIKIIKYSWFFFFFFFFVSERVTNHWWLLVRSYSTMMDDYVVFSFSVCAFLSMKMSQQWKWKWPQCDRVERVWPLISPKSNKKAYSSGYHLTIFFWSGITLLYINRCTHIPQILLPNCWRHMGMKGWSDMGVTGFIAA